MTFTKLKIHSVGSAAPLSWLGFISIFFLLIFISSSVIAEGTRQLEPTNPSSTPNRRLRVVFEEDLAAHRIQFAYVGCPEKYRLNVYISNPTTEKIYFGFNDDSQNIYYQIKDPDGIVVAGYSLAAIPTTGNGYISNWTEAYNGPKIGTVNPSGYDPLILTPTKTGNYYFEFASNSTGGHFYNSKDMRFFDISVVDGTTVKNGRLWSKAWQFTDGIGSDNILSYPANLFIYTDDQIVDKLNINEWNGGTYVVYCNQWGVTNSGNWAIDRKSLDNWPSSGDLPQYKIFLNDPDSNAYPTGTLG
ncbi:MAG: hypothetical protein IPH45_19645 [Bacteroidales bacterium]|nr:hypothetical protein [Bacteroidales bacterium]